MATLTKNELKSELINHGVKPPPTGTKKEEFVKLYEKHVAHHQETAGEFSSDDEGAEKRMNGDEVCIQGQNPVNDKRVESTS